MPPVERVGIGRHVAAHDDDALDALGRGTGGERLDAEPDRDVPIAGGAGHVAVQGQVVAEVRRPVLAAAEEQDVTGA